MPYPILLCTFTNVAVDNLVEGIIASSLRPVRVGSSAKIKSSLQSYAAEKQLQNHRLTPEWDRVKAKIEVTYKRRRTLEQKIIELKAQNLTKNLNVRLENMEMDLISIDRQEKAYKAKAYAIYMEMLRDIVLSADVVSGDCSDPGSYWLISWGIFRYARRAYPPPRNI